MIWRLIDFSRVRCDLNHSTGCGTRHGSKCHYRGNSCRAEYIWVPGRSQRYRSLTGEMPRRPTSKRRISVQSTIPCLRYVLPETSDSDIPGLGIRLKQDAVDFRQVRNGAAPSGGGGAAFALRE